MAKHNRNFSPSVVDDTAEEVTLDRIEEVGIDPESITEYNKVQAVVKITSLRDAQVRVTGQVTGKQYTWNGRQSIDVDSLDAEIILAKTVDTGCCGNPKGKRKLFVIAD